MNHPYVAAYYNDLVEPPIGYTADKMVAMAAHDGAPDDAYMRRADGSWATISAAGPGTKAVMSIAMIKYRKRSQAVSGQLGLAFD